MAFTNMDADAFMTAHMGDNDDEYASAVESKIAEHEAWSSPLIDLVLNHECPVTSCLLKAVKTGANGQRGTMPTHSRIYWGSCRLGSAMRSRR